MSSYSRLSVKLVSNHYWCPTLAWLKVHGPEIAWRPPHITRDHMELVGYSDIIEEALEDALRRLSSKCRVVRVEKEKQLYSSMLRLAGSIDMLVYCEDSTRVVEAKLRHPRRDDPAYIQVGLYMLLAEHNGFQNVRGYISSPGFLQEVSATWKNRALEELLATMRTIKIKNPPPPKRPLATCRTCVYRRVCPYGDLYT